VIRSGVVDPTGDWLAVIVADAPENHSQLHLVNLRSGESQLVWDSPRSLVGLQWSPAGDALYVSQLGREREQGWILNRLRLATLSPEPLVEHRGGWALSPDGRQMAIAPGSLQRLRVFDVAE
jgi:hypothetical protein